MKTIITSKRFWVALATAATAIGAAYGGEISWGQAINTAIAAALGLIVAYTVREPEGGK